MRSFAKAVTALVLLVGLNAFAGSDNNGRFPTGPDAVLTPGDVCHRPDQFRYPERIAYCSRNVDTSEKKDIIAMYDRERGFQVGRMNRGDFKIDHFIPLCMGGSNERDNLWPQHRSVYNLTDPMEGLACDKMAKGKLKQAEAIQLIKKAKLDLSQVDGVIAYLNSL